MKEKIWNKGDLLAGLLTGLIAFAVYAWTVAPNVTLLDSGEFMVAAQHFGVPHPTGYPLWTLLTWIFQLLPLGNAAWEINLFSAFCGGLAVALTTALSRSSLRWLLEEQLDIWPGLGTMIPVVCGLLFAFSFSMWSQATIAEVYTLHALMIGTYLTVLYIWLRRPECLGLLLLAFFVIALSFSNHHLSVSMAPLPFLAVLLVRREMFWELVVASLMTALLAYLGFSILSGEPLVLKTAIRFFYCVMLGLVVLVIVRRFNIEWRLIAYLPFVVALGLLPYAYLPFASSTNPPMNWAYTRTPEGFYYSFNRSQYSGSLSQQSLRSLGRLVGTVGEKPPPEQPAPGELPPRSLYSQLQDWAGFFWLQLGRSFTPIGILGYFGALFVILRLKNVEQRTWVYVLELGFVLAAILQPVADDANIDNSGWWLQMPYHTYTNLIFTVLAALGIALGISAVLSRYPKMAWTRFLLLALPIMPLVLNEAGCSQRGRWFGWEFGHDMLKDLPKSSVVFGGTDPGRFVPTYMILGESGQPAALKRDPDFDRRDLYIITQNGVGEPLYRKYLADHYGLGRPAPKNAFERWLGRAETYPEKPLVFPTEEEIDTAVHKEIEDQSKKDIFDPSVAHSVVTRLIWEKNRDAHEFFVEESFPLAWSYDYALPHGLCYRIMKDPQKEIPADVVAADMQFWDGYMQRLINDPEFSKDYDAQRSFSKLRTTTGNLYKHRKMSKEAEIAYRQSLILWPGNPESLNEMSTMLWDRGDFDGVLKLLEPANAEDPNNMGLWRLRAIAEKRKELEGEIRDVRTVVEKNPKDLEKTEKLLELYYSTGDTNRSSELLKSSVEIFGDNPEFLLKAVQYSEGNSLPERELEAAKKLAVVGTNVGDDYLYLACAYFRNNDKTNFYATARTAIEKGGIPVRQAILVHPLFAPWRDDAEFKKLEGTGKK